MIRLFLSVLLPFVLLATANSAGYRYGASDQAFYAPAVMQRLDPSLFPRDTLLLNTQAHLTLADETVAALAKLTGLGLPALFAVLYVLTLALIASAVVCIGHLMYRERWTIVAVLAAVSLRHAITKSGTNTLEGYFHTRQLAFALGALAVCAFMQRRYAALALLLGAAAALHPTTTLWFAVWLYVATMVAEPRWRAALGGAALAAAPVVWWAFAAGPLEGRLVTMDSEWLSAIGEKDYLFPLQWPFHAWALNLGYVAAVIAVWRMRRVSGHLHVRETAVVAGCLSLAIVFGCALVLQSKSIALAIQLQPARVFWMLDFLAVVYLVWALAEGVVRPGTFRAAALACVLIVASALRGTYIMAVEFPDRPLAQIGVRDDDWGRVMAWGRSTERSSGWLADPAHAALYGTSVRVAAERDVFVEATKDTALGMYDRAIAMRARDRIAALGDFDALSVVRARELGATYDLDFLVTPTSLDLPIVFQSGPLRVYRIDD